MRSTIGTVCRSLLVAAILASLQVASAQAQSRAPKGSIGLRLLEAPQSLAAHPRARVYVIDHLDRGDTIRRRVEVSSGLDHAERLSLYAAGAVVSGGRFRFLEGRTQNELSSWITVSPRSVELSPHGSATATVTIAVPKDAADGERYGVVWAETPPSISANGGLATVGRVGIRVYLSVGRGGAPPTDFSIESLTASRDRAGRQVVSAMVVNTGGRAIDPAGTLRLSDGPGGLSAGPFPVELGTTIGIGQRAPVRVVLSEEIPDGPWTAELRLRSDLVQRRARAKITFPTDPGTRSVPVPAAPVDRSVPWLLILIVIGLAVGAWLLFAFRRRRRSDPDDREAAGRPVDAPPTAARA